VVGDVGTRLFPRFAVHRPDFGRCVAFRFGVGLDGTGSAAIGGAALGHARPHPRLPVRHGDSADGNAQPCGTALGAPDDFCPKPSYDFGRSVMGMFWSDKTEAPTPKRREDARKRGIVPRSAELTGTIVLLCGAMVAGWLLPSWLSQFGRRLFRIARARRLDTALAKVSFARPRFRRRVDGSLFARRSFADALFVHLLPVALGLAKSQPRSGSSAMLSAMAMWDAMRTLLKAALVGYLGFLTLKAGIDNIVGASNLSVTQSVVAIGNLAWQVLWRCLLALLLLAALDYAVQWWRVERSLRMTRQEVKDELKQTEGDPNIKARLRARSIANW